MAEHDDRSDELREDDTRSDLRTRRADSRSGEGPARAYPELARALKKRGVDPTSLFAAMAEAAEAHPSLSAQLIEVGSSFFVRYVWEPAEPTDTWTDFILVNDRFEARAGLALFAQLLMNGAIDDLRKIDDVLHAFEVSRAGYPVRTEKDAIGLVNNYADEKADADLVEQWEPPFLDGRTLRFCYDDTRGNFGAITVDVETCAVACERRCKGPVYYLEGRAYLDDDARAVVARLVVG